MTRSHIYIHARPGHRDELVQVLDRLELLTATRHQPGFLAAEIQAPVGDDSHVLVWSSWASPEHHERWLASSGYQQILSETQELRTGEPEVRVYRVLDALQSSTTTSTATG
jgi:quinol monooxygenase YgiN